MSGPGSAPILLDAAELKEAMGEDWTFVSEDDVVRGMATVGGDVVHKDMDEELVYQLVKAHAETLEDLMAKAPFGRTVGFGILDAVASSVCSGHPLKYHKGASRAWEDAGFEVPGLRKGHVINSVTRLRSVGLIRRSVP